MVNSIIVSIFISKCSYCYSKQFMKLNALIIKLIDNYNLLIYTYKYDF